MATAVSGDKSSRTKANKEQRAKTYKKELERRKAWRLRRYGSEPTKDLTRGTLKLFIKWGHRVDECKNTVRTRQFKKIPKKRTGFESYWG